MPQPPPSGRRPAWFDDDASGHSEAERLAQALRTINELLIALPPDNSELAALTAQSEEWCDRLAAKRAATVAPDAAPRRLDRSSPVTGRANAAAPPVRLWLDGDSVCGSANFGAAYEGPPGHVHGGVIAAAFDEVLGATQALTEQTGMTGTLSVRYRRPTPLHRDVLFRGRVQRVSGRKLLASATLHVDGKLCAEAEAIFVAIDFAALDRLRPPSGH